jgi:hypothetical protein
MPEHGRNLQPNSVIDIYGRYALDHNNDEMSRRIFGLIAGPSSVVKQGQVFKQCARRKHRYGAYHCQHIGL